MSQVFNCDMPQGIFIHVYLRTYIYKYLYIYVETNIGYTWWNDGIKNMPIKPEDGCKDWHNFGELY